MTYDEVKAQLGLLADAMAAKGLVTPRVVNVMESNSTDMIMMQHKYGTDKYITRASIWDGIADAWAYCHALPSPEETARANATKAVGAAIEACREANMPLDFINPLTEAMKRLSENAITKVQE